MSDTQHDVEDDEDTKSTLRLFADIQEAGTVTVTLTPAYLREVADYIESLENDVIVISDTKGEELARIEGDQASHVIKAAVQEFVIQALREAVEGVQPPPSWQLP